MAIIRAFPRISTTRHLLTLITKHYATPSFGQGPAPPRLPEEEQRLYEKLQQASTGAFSTPKATSTTNQSAASSGDRDKTPLSEDPHEARVDARVQATGKGEELHPNIRRGAQPEFEGEINPRTGEIRGPKNDPLRWKGDWSYNGRVSDF